MATWNNWAAQVLKAGGYPVTATNLKALAGWQASEGGTAANNPLNTTHGEPGATPYNQNGGYPVLNYASPQVGIDATIKTLNNGHYGDIVNLLKQGNYSLNDFGKAVQSSPWGTKQGQIGQWASGAGTAPPLRGSVSPPAASPGLPKVNPQTGMTGLGNRLLQAQMLGQVLNRTSGGLIGNDLFTKVLQQRQMASVKAPAAQTTTKAAPVTSTPQGGFLQAPMAGTWKGTHVTDNLGWGTNTAEDIMGAPGTAVGAPEAGVIERHGSAQGGQSLYFKGASGHEYWLGHIESDMPVGTKVAKGQVIAKISGDHPRPHLHIDYR